jgi:flavin reductase (DIM6/NTAB) family NADH-FMN oxidoreductase RutF
MQVPTDFESAIVRKYPEGIAIAITRDAQGKHNPITLCWVMRTSFDPPMLAMSVALTRHSLGAVRQAREFVVSLPSKDMVKDAVFFGSVSGRDLDKLAQSGVKTQPATVIDSVLLTDAVANFECKLEAELQTGDHVIFVGRVVASHRNEDPGVRGLYALGDYQFGGVVAG